MQQISIAWLQRSLLKVLGLSALLCVKLSIFQFFKPRPWGSLERFHLVLLKVLQVCRWRHLHGSRRKVYPAGRNRMCAMLVCEPRPSATGFFHRKYTDVQPFAGHPAAGSVPGGTCAITGAQQQPAWPADGYQTRLRAPGPASCQSSPPGGPAVARCGMAPDKTQCKSLSYFIQRNTPDSKLALGLRTGCKPFIQGKH